MLGVTFASGKKEETIRQNCEFFTGTVLPAKHYNLKLLAGRMHTDADAADLQINSNKRAPLLAFLHVTRNKPFYEREREVQRFIERGALSFVFFVLFFFLQFMCFADVLHRDAPKLMVVVSEDQRVLDSVREETRDREDVVCAKLNAINHNVEWENQAAAVCIRSFTHPATRPPAEVRMLCVFLFRFLRC